MKKTISLSLVILFIVSFLVFFILLVSRLKQVLKRIYIVKQIHITSILQRLKKTCKSPVTKKDNT